jgi:methylglutaconyl-CoA hydratase
MTEKSVTVSVDARGVATVCLNRPEKHNAFDDTMIAELMDVFQSLAVDPQARVMVLRSTGRSFSAGADLGWMKRMAGYSHEQNYQDARCLAQMLHALNEMPKPTIARIQGAAFGGAVGLVACCDMAVASHQASFALSEVRIGLIPATISPYVIEAIGSRQARRYFLTAERFDAERALQIGLISERVEASLLDDRINSLIDTMLGNGPAAVAAAKQLIFDMAGRPVTEALLEDTSQRIAGIRVSAEGQEGLGAFLDKRSPRWLKG